MAPEKNSLELTIPDDADGQRLDRAVADLLPGHSRSSVARLIGDGRVFIDTVQTTKASHPVRAGARISVDLPDPVPAGIVSQEIPLEFLYQDDDIAVVNKPPGLVVHPAAGHADSTVVNALLFHLDDLSGVGGEIRPGIVHRLDKDTSGVMIVAKNDAAHRFLTDAWGTERVRKEYLALVYGAPSPDHGKIEKPIGRDPVNRKKMAVVAQGRAAITLYTTVEQFRYVSLLRCTLKTGRTHQIRVHLKSIGHPVVGDPLYAGPQWRGMPDRRLQRTISSFTRQALHAAKLTIPHPRTGEAMTFEAPLPDDMRQLLDALRG